MTEPQEPASSPTPPETTTPTPTVPTSTAASTAPSPDPAGPSRGTPVPPGRPPAASVPAPEPRRPGALADPPPFQWPSLRPVVGILVLIVLVGGGLYPLAVDGVERATGGLAPNGSFVPGGDPSSLANGAIGQNITNLSLFWLRPSLTDYNTTLSSGESPYGPTDPNLVNLTKFYLGVYGLNNTTVPLDLVGNSESGIDPDLSPAAVLVQIPRVAAHTALTQAFLTTFVSDRIVGPVFGLVGPEYVNLIELDEDLAAHLAQVGSP